MQIQSSANGPRDDWTILHALSNHLCQFRPFVSKESLLHFLKKRNSKSLLNSVFSRAYPKQSSTKKKENIIGNYFFRFFKYRLRFPHFFSTKERESQY
jgi:hypothetical protein